MKRLKQPQPLDTAVSQPAAHSSPLGSTGFPSYTPPAPPAHHHYQHGSHHNVSGGSFVAPPPQFRHHFSPNAEIQRLEQIPGVRKLELLKVLEYFIIKFNFFYQFNFFVATFSFSFSTF